MRHHTLVFAFWALTALVRGLPVDEKNQETSLVKPSDNASVGAAAPENQPKSGKEESQTNPSSPTASAATTEEKEEEKEAPEDAECLDEEEKPGDDDCIANEKEVVETGSSSRKEPASPGSSSATAASNDKENRTEEKKAERDNPQEKDKRAEKEAAGPASSSNGSSQNIIGESAAGAAADEKKPGKEVRPSETLKEATSATSSAEDDQKRQGTDSIGPAKKTEKGSSAVAAASPKSEMAAKPTITNENDKKNKKGSSAVGVASNGGESNNPEEKEDKGKTQQGSIKVLPLSKEDNGDSDKSESSVAASTSLDPFADMLLAGDYLNDILPDIDYEEEENHYRKKVRKQKIFKPLQDSDKPEERIFMDKLDELYPNTNADDNKNAQNRYQSALDLLSDIAEKLNKIADMVVKFSTIH